MKKYLVAFGISLIVNSSIATNWTAIKNNSNYSKQNIINEYKYQSKTRRSRNLLDLNYEEFDKIFKDLNLSEKNREEFLKDYENFYGEFKKDPSKIKAIIKELKNKVPEEYIKKDSDFNKKTFLPLNTLQPMMTYQNFLDHQIFRKWKYEPDVESVLKKPDNHWYTLAGIFSSPILKKPVREDFMWFQNSRNKNRKFVGQAFVHSTTENFADEICSCEITSASLNLFVRYANGRNNFEILRIIKLHKELANVEYYHIPKYHEYFMNDWNERLDTVSKRGVDSFKPEHMFRWLESGKPDTDAINYLNSRIKKLGGIEKFLHSFKKIRDVADAEQKLSKIIANMKMAKKILNGVIIALGSFSAALWAGSIFTKGALAPSATLASFATAAVDGIKEIINLVLKKYEEVNRFWRRGNSPLNDALEIGRVLKKIAYDVLATQLKKFLPFKIILSIVEYLISLISNTLELFDFF